MAFINCEYDWGGNEPVYWQTRLAVIDKIKRTYPTLDALMEAKVKFNGLEEYIDFNGSKSDEDRVRILWQELPYYYTAEQRALMIYRSDLEKLGNYVRVDASQKIVNPNYAMVLNTLAVDVLFDTDDVVIEYRFIADEQVVIYTDYKRAYEHFHSKGEDEELAIFVKSIPNLI